ncbi:urease accessory protein UreD [Salinibacterium sp. dk2585]|uniref:urease accessory protein UreD n=1 Tax=unclassified Salinibacterium TaxID=2632331 RepID=UPI0011C25425|nr:MULTISPECIES: urease accessory protein UreD [unclassified Salinibacterium]QEE62062.1 urease accessory protein UreD [Salinibacterium sp. dk2585]TXK53414.1 urease accessory protein UreD [Salinibacterium sp. dk5596]
MYIGLERAGETAQVQLRGDMLAPRLLGAGRDSARVGIIAGEALLLAGDTVETEVRVGEGCTLELEDIGGTVAYGGDGAASRWRVSITVERGARLIWHTMPFVVADGADVCRTTSIVLGRGAVAMLRETFVLGRTGESGGRLLARTDVELDGRALYRESLTLDGALPRIGVLGTHRVIDSAMSLGRRRASPPGALQLAGEGTIVRAMGNAAHLATVESEWAQWVSTPSLGGNTAEQQGAPATPSLHP